VKRFYKEAAVGGDAAAGWTVLLDGRPVRTPGRALLALPTRRLADAVAGEWTAQGETVNLRAMPLLRLSNTALDRVRGQREAVIGSLAGYGASDLLCYRAAHPPDLAERQRAAWDPVVAWANRRHGLRLRTTEELTPIEQEAETLARLAQAVARYDDWRLVALHEAVALTGSLLLGLALLEGALDRDAVWQAALVDEVHQEERWGVDGEMAARRQALAADLDGALAYLALLDE